MGSMGRIPTSEFSEVFHHNKDWNGILLVKRRKGSSKFSEVFHHNKDWNSTIRMALEPTTVFSEVFHHNKDWNWFCLCSILWIYEFSEVFHHNKDWNRVVGGYGTRRPVILRGIPPQQGLKHLMSISFLCAVIILRGIPPQQGLKLWWLWMPWRKPPDSQRYSTTTRIETPHQSNHPGRLPNSQRYSTTTRIETGMRAVTESRWFILRGIPPQQGLKLNPGRPYLKGV